MPSVTTAYLETDGARLAYDVTGSGPPLLLLHAGIADRRMWDDQVPAFAERYRVIRCDLPGFGDSPMPAGEFALEALLAALLERVAAPRAGIVACSLGGRTALDFVLEYPQRVAALVLVGSGVGGYRMADSLDASEERIEAALEAGDLDAAAEIDIQVWVDGPHRRPDQLDPAVRARAHAMARHNYVVALAATEPGGPARRLPPASERLNEIQVPTLVLVGDQDQPDMLTIADLLAGGIAGARKVVMDNVAHLPNMEQPDTFNRLVLDFLATLPAWNGGSHGG